jgi:hypothetical protein
MNCYQEITDGCGNVLCRIEKKKHGVVKIENLKTGRTAYIKNGKIIQVEDNSFHPGYPEPSAPPAESYTI